MNNLLVAIAGLICAILIAALTAPFFINWNSFKSELEIFGSKITGQNVQIIGDVALRILPQPVFHTGGLVVTDADNQKIIETSDFTMELDFPSLLKGKIEVTSMLLSEGRLHVSKTENATLNLFNFGGKIGQPIGLEDISIDNLTLKNMDVIFTNFVTDNQKTFSIKHAIIKARSLKGPFKIKGVLNVDANDVVLERSFSVSTGKYNSEKPLNLKIQVDGVEKKSKIQFSGNLVGLEQQPLLVGKLTVKGAKGEDMLGFGATFGAKLADELQMESDVSVNYSALKLNQLKLQLGSSDKGDISKFIKISGDLNYNWGLKPSLDGALNIGVVEYDYITNIFLVSNVEKKQQPIYKSLKALSNIGESWLKQHVMIGNKQPHEFAANISINIDQINFLQNNIIDRVRLIRGLLNISGGKIYLPQFSAQLPGNSKLTYSLSQYSANTGDKQIMGGLLEFEALHMRRFTNWLLFANKQLNNINDFWKLNSRLSLNGRVDLLDDGLKIVAQNVKSKGDVYDLIYQFKDGSHKFNIGFDMLSFNTGYLKELVDYLEPFANNAFGQSNSDKNKQYHLLPSTILNEIGDVELNLQSDKTFFDVRDVGVFEASVKFNPNTTLLQNISLIGERVNIKAKGYLPNAFEANSIKNDAKRPAILEFSLIDLEMKFIPSLVQDLLFKGNFLFNKLVPAKGPLNVRGKLEQDADSKDMLSFDIAGKIGTSDVSINSEITVKDGGFKQNNIQYEMRNINSAALLKQFNLDEVHQNISENNDAILRLFISNNPTNISEKELKIIALVGEQEFDLSGDINDASGFSFNGPLSFKLNQLGKVFSTTRSFNQDFDHIFGESQFTGDLVINDNITRLKSQNFKLFESNFSDFNLEYDDAYKLVVNGKTKRLDIKNMLSFLTGNDVQNSEQNAKYLDDRSKNILASANQIFAENDDSQTSTSFHLKMMESLDLDLNIQSDRLYLTDLLWLKNAKIKVFSNKNNAALTLDYEGMLGGRKVAGNISMLPDDGQLVLDVTSTAFGLDLVALANVLGIKMPNMAGKADIVLDATGKGYSVKGLLANITGIVDIDLKNVTSQYMDSRTFNINILQATSDAMVENTFLNLVAKKLPIAKANTVTIGQEKVSATIKNGLAIVNQQLEFFQNGSKIQNGLMVGQADLTGKNSQFSLNIPISDDVSAPKIVLHYERNQNRYDEIVDFENIKEYFKVKLLEKNVERLEALQIEIKRKNDAEISRYLNEKKEASLFKEEIKVRVEEAIDARKLSEVAQALPQAPLRMPFLFVSGSNEGYDFANSLIGNNKMIKHNSLGDDKDKFIALAVVGAEINVPAQPTGGVLPNIVKNPLQAGNNLPALSANDNNVVSEYMVLKKLDDKLLKDQNNIVLDIVDEPLDALGENENSNDEGNFDVDALNNESFEISSDLKNRDSLNNLEIGDLVTGDIQNSTSSIIEIKPIPDLN